MHPKDCKSVPLATAAAQLSVSVQDGGMVMWAAASVAALGAWSASKSITPLVACCNGKIATLKCLACCLASRFSSQIQPLAGLEGSPCSTHLQGVLLAAFRDLFFLGHLNIGLHRTIAFLVDLSLHGHPVILCHLVHEAFHICMHD